MAKSKPEPVTAVWARRHGDDLEILVEIEDEWRTVINVYDPAELALSHIVEARTFLRSPVDDLAGATTEKHSDD